MNASASPSFRGGRAIAELVGRMKPLADFLQAFHPSCHVLTLARRDLDLLQRWPDTAFALYGIVTANGVTHWRGFELRADKTRTRYPSRP